MIDRGEIVGVHRRGELRFPGFQFDPETKQIRPVIKTLVKISAGYGYDLEDLQRRAEQQVERIETERMLAIRQAFAAAVGSK